MNVQTSRFLTKKEVELKLLNSLNSVANIIVNKQKFGVDRKVDYIKAIRTKNYLEILENINNTSYLGHYFNTCDKTLVLNKLIS